MNTTFKNLPDTEFQRALALMDACGSARDWVDGKTLEEAWATCSNEGWMNWLVVTINLAVCTCSNNGEIPDVTCPLSKVECATADELRQMFSAEDVAAAVIRHIQPMMPREQ